MKKFLESRYGEAIVFTAISILSFLFTIIYYSIPLGLGENPLWTAKTILTIAYRITGLSTYFVIAFFVGLALFAASCALVFVKRKKILCYISTAYNVILSMAFLFAGMIIRLHTTGTIVFAILSIIASAASLAFLIIRRNTVIAEKRVAEEQTEETATASKPSPLCKIVMLVCESLATVLMFSTLFIPVFSSPSFSSVSAELFTYYTLIGTLSSSYYPIYMYIAFVVMFVACFVQFLNFIATVSFYKVDKVFAQKSQWYMQGAAAFTLVFFILGYCLTFYLNLSQQYFNATTASYVPFVGTVILLIVFSIFYGKSGLGESIADKLRKNTRLKVEPLLYVAALTIITFSTLLFNVITIDFSISSTAVSQTSLTGLEMLKSHAELAAGFQIMSFLLFSILTASGVMLTLCVASLLSKNKDYYKVIKTSAIANLIFVTLMGLFGLYFKIAQKVNEENLTSLLQYLHLENFVSYEYNVKSDTIYLLIASVVVIIIMMLRKQFNLTVEEPLKVEFPADEQLPSRGEKNVVQNAKTDEVAQLQDDSAATFADFDACPAFTELDGKEAQYIAETEERRKHLFENPTLPNIVRFVVDYARECRLHLSYSLEDIATFVAGLGASRLAILQGMSGTGKTSLPKIFAEALMGNCEIVEVESSWRDKNELLGYYNEFSKCYTPKKFTQCLYKAKLNKDVLTFIVLDEMNLSRIEYYFSDFLSLMENEEDKREIKLLNVKLHRTVGGELLSYNALTDGHTLKVPANVWFVGTANRDESTFAISDKVYDRAQTMNFDKRAPKIHSFSEPLPQRFTTYESLRQLFDEAKANGKFDAEESAIVRQVEKLLAPYNISFGNRILKQMEDFVKIYCACFGDRDAVLKDAVEKILLSKVVSKLENKVVENKEALAAEFNKIGLAACSAFVRKLNED